VKTYLIGRSPKADIVIAPTEYSVDDIHLELVERMPNQYDVFDCDSHNGTFRKRGGRWLPIQQGCITLDERILLGKYPTTVRQLLALRQHPMKKNCARIKRDPETGEILPLR
jgi:hypothetical protein